MDKIYVIDRLEGDKAVLIGDDNGDMTTVEMSNLPEGAAEGDCLRLENGEWRRDLQAAEERKAKAHGLFFRLTGRDKKSY